MKKIEIDLGANSYAVCFGDDFKIAGYKKVLIVSNPKVFALHGANLLARINADEVFVATIKDGEKYKNLQSVNDILENAFIHKMDRKSLIIGFGGGVITDMAGFAAGIFMRGIDFINIPTTLLAQVDASVGGKTGVNNDFGKNLIGLFYQPKAVFINAKYLDSLSVREIRAGIAEIIKIAVCFDKEFFEWLEGANLLENRDDLKKAIYKSVAIKARIVAQDEREGGIRAGLNYGHTFGHIIELLGKYREFLHGEAVALGIIKANALAVKLGAITSDEANRIQNLIAKNGLPISYAVSDKNDFFAKFYLDKKSQNSILRFVLPDGIGDMQIIENPPKETILEIL
ncbi:3-dehydroquinate synthase [Helicobacter sp. 23-1045]